MADPVTPESIAESANSPASASAPDGRSASAHSIPDQITALQLQQAEEAANGSNAQGGPRSAWNMTRPATAIMPGATRRS